MDCNKDEATRAKAFAESKIEQGDYVGAKKLVLLAQNLYPGLDGISQMLAILDVYLSAENKISGEVDWYQVLGVSPSADDGVLRKQYKKLALMLHPDKNRSFGADGAFQLISEAHRLLTDKQNREAYNQRTGYMGFQQKVPTHNGGPSAPWWANQHNVPAYSGSQSVPPGQSQQNVPPAPPRRSQKEGPSATPRRNQQKVPAHAGGSSAPPQPSQHTAPAQTGEPSMPTHPSGSSTPYMANEFFNFASRTKSTPKSRNRKAKVPMTPNPATFWTICRICRRQLEYHKEYRHSALICVTCFTPFLAVEIDLPKFSGSARPVRKRQSANLPSQNACDPKGNVAAAQKPGAGQTSPNSYMNTHCQQGPLPGTANTDSRFPSTAEKPGNAVPLKHVNLKRSHTESHGSAGWEGGTKKGKLVYYPKGNVAATQTPGAGQTSPNSYMNTHCEQGPFPGTANTDSRFPSTAEKPGNAVPLIHVNLQRSHTESHGSAGWEGGTKKGKLVYYPKGNVAATQIPGAGQTSSNFFMNAHYQQDPLPGTANTDSRFPSTAEKPGNAVPLKHRSEHFYC